jgi:hypothetical protein
MGGYPQAGIPLGIPKKAKRTSLPTGIVLEEPAERVQKVEGPILTRGAQRNDAIGSNLVGMGGPERKFCVRRKIRRHRRVRGVPPRAQTTLRRNGFPGTPKVTSQQPITLTRHLLRELPSICYRSSIYMVNDHDENFTELDRMCEEAKNRGTDHILVHNPGVLGDNYEQLVRNLNQIAEAGLSLQILPPSQRKPE